MRNIRTVEPDVCRAVDRLQSPYARLTPCDVRPRNKRVCAIILKGQCAGLSDAQHLYMTTREQDLTNYVKRFAGQSKNDVTLWNLRKHGIRP